MVIYQYYAIYGLKYYEENNELLIEEIVDDLAVSKMPYLGASKSPWVNTIHEGINWWVKRILFDYREYATSVMETFNFPFNDDALKMILGLIDPNFVNF